MTKFSIFATQPSQYTLSRHYHEFRHVHAIQTKEIAPLAGIQTYTQGFVPYLETVLGDKLTANTLPLPRLESFDTELTPLTVVAALEWPSIEAINGSFKSPEYQATAGAHEFAKPQVIYVTEELESLVDQAKRFNLTSQSPYARSGLARARLVVALKPQNDDSFKSEWDQHATLVHSLIDKFVSETEALPMSQLPTVEYQRQLSHNFTEAELDSVLDGSPFRLAKYRMVHGGYEELAFLHMDLLVDFLKKFGRQLHASYETFAETKPTANGTMPSFAVVCDEARMVDKN